MKRVLAFALLVFLCPFAAGQTAATTDSSTTLAAFQRLKSLAGEYRQWAVQLRARGLAISGMKLQDTSISLNGAPSPSTYLAGFFAIHAKNADEASGLRAVVRICDTAARS